MSDMAIALSLLAPAAMVAILVVLLIADLLQRRRKTERKFGPSQIIRSEPMYIRPEALLDQRSLMQSALKAFEDHLQIESPETKAICERVVRILKSQPSLVASAVISDNELVSIELTEGWSTIWTVSTNDEIEFHYPASGPSFAPIVMVNLARGVKYRYLVPRTERALERAGVLQRTHPELEIRFMDEEFQERFTYTLDHLVVYEAQPSSGGDQAYYSFPGSNPPRWIAVDATSVLYRLEDVKQAWKLAGAASS